MGNTYSDETFKQHRSCARTGNCFTREPPSVSTDLLKGEWIRNSDGTYVNVDSIEYDGRVYFLEQPVDEVYKKEDLP